jgi:hypothetical protein
MEARHNHDCLIDDSIEKTVRKTMDQGPTGFAAYYWIGPRHLPNGLHGGSDLFEEFLAEPLPLALVSDVSLGQIRGSRGPIDELHRE